MAVIHATKNETQPAASMVSFRIVTEGRERNGDLHEAAGAADAIACSGAAGCVG
jgi:hypothetical protein